MAPKGDVQVIEEPEIMTPENVIYWSEHYKSLQGVEKGKSRQTKARMFVRGNCISWDSDKGHWICKPLKGNKLTYHLFYNKSKANYKTGIPGEFECSCQFNQTTGLICSHILGLYLHLKIKNHNNRHTE